jgi:hypothetical protein
MPLSPDLPDPTTAASAAKTSNRPTSDADGSGSSKRKLNLAEYKRQMGLV